MEDRLLEYEIYFELAMAIDISIGGQEMFKKSLSAYLRKLNCMAGMVLEEEKDSNNNTFYSPVFAIPRHIDHSAALQQSFKCLPDNLHAAQLSIYKESLPLTEKHFKDQYIHIMELPDFGLIVLIKDQQPLDPNVIKSLLPINNKLADACLACRQKKELEKTIAQLRYLTIHDPLTNLKNRNYFIQEMDRIKEEDINPVALILCDVDGLKFINDTMGHKAGDRVLQTAAAILNDSAGEYSVTRIGGDEFAVLIPGANDEIVGSIIKTIQKNLSQYNDNHPQIPIYISTGCALKNNSSVSIDDLFVEADNTMYREKLYHSQSKRSAIVTTLKNTMEERDLITEGHAERMEALVKKIAEELNLPENRIIILRLLAQFHDIGKVGIPDRILFKSDRLTGEEKIEMARHCEIGFRIAQSSPDLMAISDLILRHHEWWDGSGYPLSLKGKMIMLSACLFGF